MDHSSLWLDVDPDDIPPPVNTREQLLPFERLSWENFERLCYRLAHKQHDVTEYRLYGTRGQEQEGIDLFLRNMAGEYETWQCKRYAKITPAEIKKAVNTFLTGDWAKRTKTFNIIVACSLNTTQLADAIEEGNRQCQDRGITLVAYDRDRLSVILKGIPELVDDFFDRPWVERFNGPEAIAKLSGRKLDRKKRLRARALLRDLYSSYFRVIDGGIPAAGPKFRNAISPVAVFDRYVEPNVEVIDSHIESNSEAVPGKLRDTGVDPAIANASQQSTGSAAAEGTFSYGFRRREVRTKTSLFQALPGNDRLLLIGGAGHGKSAALRVLHYLILGDDTPYPLIAKSWGHRLPILLPFAFLTGHFTNEQNASIEASLILWLKRVGAKDEVLELLSEVLADDRLLLLVDGLDEWNNQEAAATAITALTTFVQTRKIPLIATGRPLGFERIGEVGIEWKRVELQPLSSDQITAFSAHWFKHFHGLSQDLDAAGQQLATDRDSTDFSQELSEDQDLFALASIPLLLSALIYLRLTGRVLPHSRYAALEELTKALLEDQPSRRAQSAMLTNDGSEIRSRSVRRGIEYVAFSIHSEPNSLSIPNQRASQLLSAYFQETDDLTKSEADEMADGVVTLGKTEFGLLISTEDDHIGVVHRIFQEFLAAKYLAKLPLQKALDYASTNSMRRGWHDVTINLLHMLERETDADAVIDSISQATIDPIDESLRQLLLASISVSNTHCSRKKARSILIQTFSWIELGRWMPLRQALIQQVAAGLQSEQVSSILIERIRRWFPGRVDWLHDSPIAAAQRPTSQTPFDLWISFHNSDSASDMRKISEAIASLAQVRPAFEDDLLSIIKGPSNPEMTSCALHALARGWPANAHLQLILDECIRSVAAPIRIVAALIQFSRGSRSEDIRNIFTQACVGGERSWPWEGDVLTCLCIGWPNNNDMKREAFRGIRDSNRHQKAWSSEASATYLLRGCAGDSEVAEAIANQLKLSDLNKSGFIIHRNHSDLLAGFTGNPLVVPAAEEWLATHAPTFYSPMEVAVVARLGGTPRCACALIDWLKSGNSMPYWIIEAAFAMLPPNDPELMKTLKDYVQNIERAEGATRYLSRIIDDRELLLSTLKQIAEREHPHFSSIALAEIVALERGAAAPWIISLIESKLQSDERGFFWNNSYDTLLRGCFTALC